MLMTAGVHSTDRRCRAGRGMVTFHHWLKYVTHEGPEYETDFYL